MRIETTPGPTEAESQEESIRFQSEMKELQELSKDNPEASLLAREYEEAIEVLGKIRSRANEILSPERVREKALETDEKINKLRTRKEDSERELGDLREIYKTRGPEITSRIRELTGLNPSDESKLDSWRWRIVGEAGGIDRENPQSQEIENMLEVDSLLRELGTLGRSIRNAEGILSIIRSELEALEGN